MSILRNGHVALSILGVLAILVFQHLFVFAANWLAQVCTTFFPSVFVFVFKNLLPNLFLELEIKYLHFKKKLTEHYLKRVKEP